MNTPQLILGWVPICFRLFINWNFLLTDYVKVWLLNTLRFEVFRMAIVYLSLPKQNYNCENIFSRNFFLKSHLPSEQLQTLIKNRKTTHIKLGYEKVAQNTKEIGAPLKKTEPL